jgi:hypothetical protein
MMGALGMAGIKMEQAQMGEMDMDMDGMKKGEKKEAPKGPQTKKAGDLTLTLSTEPTPPPRRRECEGGLFLYYADARDEGGQGAGGL